MKAGSMRSAARLLLPGQRLSDQRRYSRLFVPANSNGATKRTAREFPSVPKYNAGPFVETPRALDMALPILVLVLMGAVIAIEALFLLPAMMIGLRALAVSL